MPPTLQAPVVPTLGLQWLTESFFAPLAGKNLPGQYGQQDLIAALAATVREAKGL
jgi:hypothetical protein